MVNDGLQIVLSFKREFLADGVAELPEGELLCGYDAVRSCRVWQLWACKLQLEMMLVVLLGLERLNNFGCLELTVGYPSRHRCYRYWRNRDTSCNYWHHRNDWRDCRNHRRDRRDRWLLFSFTLDRHNDVLLSFGYDIVDLVVGT